MPPADRFVSGPPAARCGRPAPSGLCPVYGLLDNIRSAWNVGSMFRSADGAGLGGLYLCGLTAVPPRADIEKTALGACRTVPWDHWPDTLAAIDAVRQRGIQVVALECHPEAVPFDRFTYRYPFCFVVGHEVRGIAAAVLAACEAVVRIPMHGAKQSLNVAVSFGIMAYQARRVWEARSAGSSRRA